MPVVGLVQGELFYRGQPLFQLPRPGNNVGYLVIGKCLRCGRCRGHLVRFLGDGGEVLGGERGALWGVAAEAAPLPRNQLPLTFDSSLGLWFDHRVSPLQQFRHADLIDTDVV